MNVNWYFTGSTRSQASCYLLDEPDETGGPNRFGFWRRQLTCREAASRTRTFEAAAGTSTFYLNCNDANTGMVVFDIAFNAIFVPNNYKVPNWSEDCRFGARSMQGARGSFRYRSSIGRRGLVGYLMNVPSFSSATAC